MCAPDDTPQGAAPPSPARDAEDPPREPERTPLGYYYDDGAGYEVYQPAEEDEAEEDPAEE